MTILLDVILALSKRVPQLDGAVARAGDDLPVVSAEADGENVRGVADKTAGGETSIEVPEAEGVVPRRREGKLAIRRDDNIGDEVVMSVEDTLGVTVRVLFTSQLPDDDSLICVIRV